MPVIVRGIVPGPPTGIVPFQTAPREFTVSPFARRAGFAPVSFVLLAAAFASPAFASFPEHTDAVPSPAIDPGFPILAPTSTFSLPPQFVDLEDSGSTAAEEDEMVAETYPVQEVLNAIQQLSPKYTMIINLYAMEKMGHKEISEQLANSQGTSKSQLSRARMMLKQILEKKKKCGSE